VRRPLDESGLRDLALSYVARFATSGAKLEAYLARKIRERGVAEDADGREVSIDVPALVERLIELGYVDDAAYARAKSRDLLARGMGARRVDQALYAAGIEEGVRSENAPGEAEARRSAILLAKKRRFGPFARDKVGGGGQDNELDRKLREKQIAAMLRAGHGFDAARKVVETRSEDELDEWLDEATEFEASEGEDGTRFE